jgi:hypothetical protein
MMNMNTPSRIAARILCNLNDQQVLAEAVQEAKDYLASVDESQVFQDLNTIKVEYNIADIEVSAIVRKVEVQEPCLQVQMRNELIEIERSINYFLKHIAYLRALLRALNQ